MADWRHHRRNLLGLSLLGLLLLALSVVAIFLGLPAGTLPLAGAILLLGSQAALLWLDVPHESAATVAAPPPVSAESTEPSPHQQAAPEQSPPGPDLSGCDAEELEEMLEEALLGSDAEDVLDLREALVRRIAPEEAEQLDDRLAGWLANRFGDELRRGRAALVAESIGRAVASIGDHPDLGPVAESLPMIRRSVGLCSDCGRPHRGEAPTCPRCRIAKPADEQSAQAASPEGE